MLINHSALFVYKEALVCYMYSWLTGCLIIEISIHSLGIEVIFVPEEWIRQLSSLLVN